MVRTATPRDTKLRGRPRTRVTADSTGGSRRQHAIRASVHAWRRSFGVLHRITHAATGGEVTMADAFLLHFIAMHGEQTPTDIALFTGLTSGSVTSMLDRLEQAGLIQRARSAEDRRVVLVSLTAKAQEKMTETVDRAQLDVDRLFVGWTTEEIESFARLLEKFGSEDLGPQVNSR